MITTDLRRHAPQTVMELYLHNYTLYINPDADDFTKPNRYVVPWLKNYEGLRS